MVKKPKNTETIYREQILTKYLGYKVSVEYVIQYVGGRWNLSYKVIEDFSPFFSSGLGATSISGSKNIRSYKYKLDAVRAMESYLKHITIEDII